MLAYDYPVLGVFWSLLMFAFFFLWIFIVIWCFIDNFRRHDHHGVAKATVVPVHRVHPGHRRAVLPHHPAGGRRRHIGVAEPPPTHPSTPAAGTPGGAGCRHLCTPGARHDRSSHRRVPRVDRRPDARGARPAGQGGAGAPAALGPWRLGVRREAARSRRHPPGAGEDPGSRAGAHPPRAHGRVGVRVLPGRRGGDGLRPGVGRPLGSRRAAVRRRPPVELRWLRLTRALVVFDVNDFDETLPGPFEWDLKRLAASLEIAARGRGFDDKVRAQVVSGSIRGTARRSGASARWPARRLVRSTSISRSSSP